MNDFSGRDANGSVVFDDPVGVIQYAKKPGIPDVMDILRKQTVDAASIDVTYSGMPSESIFIGPEVTWAATPLAWLYGRTLRRVGIMLTNNPDSDSSERDAPASGGF